MPGFIQYMIAKPLKKDGLRPLGLLFFPLSFFVFGMANPTFASPQSGLENWLSSDIMGLGSGIKPFHWKF